MANKYQMTEKCMHEGENILGALFLLGEKKKNIKDLCGIQLQGREIFWDDER